MILSIYYKRAPYLCLRSEIDTNDSTQERSQQDLWERTSAWKVKNIALFTVLTSPDASFAASNLACNE